MNITLKSVKYNNALARDSHCSNQNATGKTKKDLGDMKEVGGGEWKPLKLKAAVPAWGAKKKKTTRKLKRTPVPQPKRKTERDWPNVNNCVESKGGELAINSLHARKSKNK